MAIFVNILGTLTVALCAVLLLRAYPRAGKRLLLWSGLCFVGLTISNMLVFIDMVIMPEISLYMWRQLVAAVSLVLLLYGLIWESDCRDDRILLAWRHRYRIARGGHVLPEILEANARYAVSRLRRRFPDRRRQPARVSVPRPAQRRPSRDLSGPAAVVSVDTWLDHPEEPKMTATCIAVIAA
jgi:hypothetical protein